MNRLLRSLLFVGCLCVMTGQAGAHATPVEYVPDAAALLEEMPEQVRIRFSERVEPSASSIRVLAPNGAEASSGGASVDAADPRTLILPLRDAGSGSYAVSWQVISADDGHFTKGAYVFSVGRETQNAAGATFDVVHRSPWPEAIAIWLELLGQAMILGVLALQGFFLLPWRYEGLSDEESLRAARRLRLLAMVAAILLVVGAALSLWQQTIALQIDRGLDSTKALETLLTTLVGRATLLRLCLGIAALALVPLASKGWKMLRQRSFLDLLLLLVILASIIVRARVSHAAASTVLPYLSVAINAIHLVAKNLWIGLVITVVTVLLPLLDRATIVSAFTRQWLRLSSILSLALGIGGVTGAYIVWLHLKDPGNLTDTHWGMRAMALLGFGILLLVLRLYQHLFVEPAAVRLTHGTDTIDDRQTIEGADVPLIAEMLTGIGILLFSSILIITTPPLRHADPFTLTQQSQDARVSFGAHPYDDAQFLLAVTSPSPVKDVTVTLTNATAGIGPIMQPVTREFAGGYVFPRRMLTPAGEWTVDIQATRTEGYDAVGHFTIRLPEDLEEKTSGSFGLLSLAAAVLIACLSLWLWVRARRSLQSLGSASTPPVVVMTPSIRMIVAAAEAAFLLFLGYHLYNHGHGAFAETCERNGGLWHENVPMQHGRATSSTAVLGCMLGSGQGQFHIADERLFKEFIQPVQSQATLTLNPVHPVAGQPATLMFHLVDGSGAAITGLSRQHDRILHAVILYQDLHTFAHVHAEDAGPITEQMLQSATFPVMHIFDKPGRYVVAVDYAVRSQSFSHVFPVDVGSPLPPAPHDPDAAREQRIDGLIVRLGAPDILRANTFETLRFHIEENGEAVRDLEPHLAAPMHIAIASADLRSLIHTHAEFPQPFLERLFSPRDPTIQHGHITVPERFGSPLEATVFFPKAGTYILFAEFKRKGEVETVRFEVVVE